MTETIFLDEPPNDEAITGYDRGHFVHYLQLLDADAEGADWREAVQIVCGIDPAREADRAKQVHQSHLARAQWMSHSGYRYLLENAQ